MSQVNTTLSAEMPRAKSSLHPSDKKTHRGLQVLRKVKQPTKNAPLFRDAGYRLLARAWDYAAFVIACVVLLYTFLMVAYLLFTTIAFMNQGYSFFQSIDWSGLDVFLGGFLVLFVMAPVVLWLRAQTLFMEAKIHRSRMENEAFREQH